MSSEHCPGFSANKSLSPVMLICPGCKKEIEIFSDEMDKVVSCPQCSEKVDPKKAEKNKKSSTLTRNRYQIRFSR